jgi:hypothetical protein
MTWRTMILIRNGRGGRKSNRGYLAGLQVPTREEDGYLKNNDERKMNTPMKKRKIRQKN